MITVPVWKLGYHFNIFFFKSVCSKHATTLPGEIVRKEYDPEEIEGWFRSFHPSSSKPFVRKHQDNEHQCAVSATERFWVFE